MPEKSGIAAGPTAGPTVCPKTGVAAATANITSEPKSRHLCMTTSLSCSSVTLAPNRPGSADFVPFEIGVTRLRGRRLRRGIEIVDDAPTEAIESRSHLGLVPSICLEGGSRSQALISGILSFLRGRSLHEKLRQLPLIEAMIANPSRRLSHSIFHAYRDS
jgi:hypothetical protein